MSGGNQRSDAKGSHAGRGVEDLNLGTEKKLAKKEENEIVSGIQ